MSRHPANMNTAVSFHWWSCCHSSSPHFYFLSILLTYMIAKWCNVSLLILIMCEDVSQQTEGKRKHRANFSVLWCAAACFKLPTNRLPKQVLRHAAACFNCWRLLARGGEAMFLGGWGAGHGKGLMGGPGALLHSSSTK